MKGPVHIVGGVFFAGFFASLWSINVFSSIPYFGAVVVGSLLPDIDHTKSIIGKLFYPLARWLDRRFGHRTVTHSLLFLIGVTVLTVLLESFLQSPDHNIALILFFSVLSHFILDMVTLQGIPLFYPFRRNPCVIPGNPDMRIESGNFKAETTAFLIFVALSFSSYDLFSNGFWTQYNRLFGTIKHVYYEFRSNTNLLEVDYSYHFNAQPYQGSALLLYATETELTLYKQSKITVLSTHNKFQIINKVQAARTEYPYIENKLIFVSVSADSLNRLLSQNLITGEIQSNYEFSVTHDNISKNAKQITFEREYSPSVITAIDTTNAEKVKQLELKKLRLKENQIMNANRSRAWNKANRELNELQEKLNAAKSPYEQNKYESELIRVRNQLKNMLPPDTAPDLVLQQEIKILETEIKSGKSLQVFSGYISFPVIPREYEKNQL
jgi:inner membrane protein